MLSFRTRRFLGKLLHFLLVTAVVAAIALLCWLLWLQRYVVYTDDGVKLDFSLPPILRGTVAVAPTQGIDVELRYETETDDNKPDDTEPILLTGIYVPEEELYGDIDAVLEKLQALPAGTPVLVDVKNYRGYFYYSTAVGSQTYGQVDTAAMDRLIAWLGSSELYAIARLPALCDYVYGAENPSAGIPLKSGALYFDENKCYWLDPTKEDTLTYLIQTARELRTLGFDEVVLREFRIPDSEKAIFTADRVQAISSAAQAIVSACATDAFTVSFCDASPTFPLPEQRSRLYLSGVAAADVEDVAAQLPEGFSPARLVFFADNTDTRYDRYGVLRPLELADFGLS